MDKQNVTLSIPKAILQKAKLIAVQQQTSLSALLTDMLTEMIAQEDRYITAKQRQLAWLEQPFDLGVQANAHWTREELHER